METSSFVFIFRKKYRMHLFVVMGRGVDVESEKLYLIPGHSSLGSELYFLTWNEEGSRWEKESKRLLSALRTHSTGKYKNITTSTCLKILIEVNRGEERKALCTELLWSIQWCSVFLSPLDTSSFPYLFQSYKCWSCPWSVKVASFEQFSRKPLNFLQLHLMAFIDLW